MAQYYYSAFQYFTTKNGISLEFWYLALLELKVKFFNFQKKFIDGWLLIHIFCE